MVSPGADYAQKWWHRMYNRQMNMPMRPYLDPDVILVRPYGLARNIKGRSMPQDYTLDHYGGTLRGAKIGMWKANLMVGAEPKPINRPTLFSWRSSQAIDRPGAPQWELDDAPEEV